MYNNLEIAKMMIRWDVLSDGSKRILGITFSVFVTSVRRALRMREHYAPRDRRLRSVQSALDFVVGLGFLAATAVVLVRSLDESPETPLRLWISVSTLQHLVHVSYVCIEYNRDRWPRLSQRRSVKVLELGNDTFYKLWFGYGLQWVSWDYSDAYILKRYCYTMMFFDAFVAGLSLMVLIGVGLPLSSFLLFYYAFKRQDQEGCYKELIYCPFCACAIPTIDVLQN